MEIHDKILQGPFETCLQKREGKKEVSGRFIGVGGKMKREEAPGQSRGNYRHFFFIYITEYGLNGLRFILLSWLGFF